MAFANKRANRLTRRLACIAASACMLALMIVVPMAMAEEDVDTSTASAVAAESTSDEALSTQSSSIAVNIFSGSNRYATAKMEATKAFASTDGLSPNGTAVLVCGENGHWADALSATSLAGAMNCPVLLTASSELSSETKVALSAMNISSVVVVGGAASVSDTVISQLSDLGVSSERISGSSRYDTQAQVYAYGKSHGYWKSGYAIVATGQSYADSLSISSAAYKYGIPIFLVDGSNLFQSSQISELYDGSIHHVIVVGGSACVSDSTFDMLQSVTAYNLIQLGGDPSYNVVRLAGSDRYDTSSKIAEYCVDQGWLNWDEAAFASGSTPADALAGSALQGKNDAVLLLVDGESCSTISTIGQHSDSITSINILGGSSAVPVDTRNAIYAALGMDRTDIDLNGHSDYNIMGSSNTTVAQMVRCYNSTGKTYPAIYANYGAATIQDFCQIVYDEATYEGVNAEVVFAQAMWETGWLQFGGYVQAYQCNFAGIGATGSVSGAVFPDVATGIRAQVQHLKGYASTDNLANACVDPRFVNLQYARGTVTTIQGLSGTWAVPGVDSQTGVTYGDNIYKIIQKLLQS